jgi:hypothetical protein
VRARRPERLRLPVHQQQQSGALAAATQGARPRGPPRRSRASPPARHAPSTRPRSTP